MDDVRYRLAYPVYVITGPGGQGLQVIDQRGMSLAVVFQHFELAELYVEQIAERGEAGCEIIPLEDRPEFATFLRALLGNGVNHLLVDSTAGGAVSKIADVGQALAAVEVVGEE